MRSFISAQSIKTKKISVQFTVHCTELQIKESPICQNKYLTESNERYSILLSEWNLCDIKEIDRRLIANKDLYRGRIVLLGYLIKYEKMRWLLLTHRPAICSTFDIKL